MKNLKPGGWSGRKYNIGLYKAHNLLVIKENVAVSEDTHLNLQSKLYFGVISGKMHLGQTISSEEVSNFTPFDLKNYPSGLKVTLTEERNSGKNNFCGLNIEEDIDSFGLNKM